MGDSYDAADFAREYGLDDTQAVVDAAPLVVSTGPGPMKVASDDARWATSHVPNERPSLLDWTVDRFQGDPPEIQWLVEEVMPLGVPGLVAAMGDTGKSMLLLELAIRVALGSSRRGPVFGGGVVAEGAAVILTAEDDRAAVHRRIAALDPEGRRFDPNGKRLIVYPLPDAGGPMSLFADERGRYVATDEWARLRDELASIPDLRLVVLDPLQAFATVPLNEDPAAGQFVCAHLGTLAATTGATVLVAHHMRKRQNEITDPAEARDAIRGSTALVDGMRLAYALWPANAATAKRAAKALDRGLPANAVVQGCVVKANGPAAREVRTFVRDGDTGLLVDRTVSVGAGTPRTSELLTALTQAVGAAAKDGKPMTRTGENGVYKRRSSFPEALGRATRKQLEDLADEALSRGLLKLCVGPGSSSARFLDVPDGPFAKGEGTVTRGAAI